MVFFLSRLHFSDASEVTKQMNSVTHSSIRCLASREILRDGSIESFIIFEMFDRGRNSSCFESCDEMEFSDIINYLLGKKVSIESFGSRLATGCLQSMHYREILVPG